MWEKGVKGSVKDAAVALSLKQRPNVFQLRSQVGTTPTCMCAHRFCRAGSSAGNDRGTTERALLCAVEPPHSKKAHRFDSPCLHGFPPGSPSALKTHARKVRDELATCPAWNLAFRVLLQVNLFAVFQSPRCLKLGGRSHFKATKGFFIPSNCQAKKQLQSI